MRVENIRRALRFASPKIQRLFLLVGAASTLTGAPAAAQAILPPASTEGLSQVIIQRANAEGRVLWLDGTANIQRLSTREGVGAVLDRCKAAHVNTVVVDVKPLSGHVLYESRHAPKLPEWKGFRYPYGYDLLRTTLEEGHRRGMKVYANINVFSDGHKLVKTGPVYGRPELQSICYDVERTLTTPRGARKTLAVGVNRVPEDGQINIYDPGYNPRRNFSPDEAFVLIDEDRVEAVVEGSLAPPDGVNVPDKGCILVGRGEGARWLLQNIRVGDTLSWTATDKFLPITEAPSEMVAAFVNPANPVSREYLMRIVDEIVSGYEIDGIVFDRMRYASLHSDFSNFSREKFEEHIGRKLDNFPADIFSFDPTPGRPLVWGPYFKQWLEWRARNIRSWLEEASKLVRTKRPNARIGVYVGSWYSSYYTVGVNWGSEDFAPGYDWMSPTYNTTGYAQLLDWVTTGCYHPIATREQARRAGLDDNYTVQAAAENSVRAVSDAAFVYAGLYVQDYKDMPEAFRDAIHAARQHSHGVMLFDLSQIEDYGYWNIITDALQQPRTAPHDIPELLAAVRALRKAVGAASRPQLF